jgi:fibronectin type 3 domain-containing protein
MRKLFQHTLFTFSLLFIASNGFSQVAGSVRQGPSGIFIFMGSEIPCGKYISSFKIERSEDNKHWQPIAELKTPQGFKAFNEAVEKAKSYFPSQPIPTTEKLRQLYEKAVATGNTDSLKSMRLLFPIRVALGIMYYDTSANQHITYKYRINSMKTKEVSYQTFVSDTISLPFSGVFDTISFSESSYNINSVLIKWKSIGKNPAPLFMVYSFKYGAPIIAHGRTSRFNLNDTTYYVYYDTTVAKFAGKEMQFFVSPFDHFGNAGRSSQVAVITQDNFNKATFVRDHIAFLPKLSGVQVCWHFTDPVTVKTVEIFRSESPDNGFRKFAEAGPNDTSYLDKQLWPEKTYYYFIQVVAKAGKRTKQSGIMMVQIPGISSVAKLNVPILRQVAVVNKNIRLLIEVNDTSASELRIYRGLKGGLVALPELVKTGKTGFIAFTDSSLALEDMKDVFYAVRNERSGTAISGLSEELPVAMIADMNEVAYFYAFPANGGVQLYWDDVVNRVSNFKSYTLARKNGPANSRSPLKVIVENFTKSSFVDADAQPGNQYTYELSLVDKNGKSKPKTYKVTIPEAR